MSLYATTDPTTGSVVRAFDTMTDDDVTVAVETAEAAYRSWSRVDLKERAALLGEIVRLYRDRQEELARTITLEMGKPLTQARGELMLVASIYQYYADQGPDLVADEPLVIAGAGEAVVRTTAIGPLLGIMPWNFPHYQVARFVAPNLLLGNTILLKHAENCPQGAVEIADLIRDAGAPEGLYQNLFATREQSAAIISHPVVQGVSLTGSEVAGRAVGEIAGRNLKRCVLELGGSDALIVRPSADLALAVEAAVTGRFNNAGQVCSAPKRLIVDAAVYDSFLDSVVERAAAWEMGDPTQESTKLGPVSSLRARSEIAAQVDDALTKGAVAHVGGHVPDREGAYYPATVLSGVTPDMRAFHEEVFGPVAVLYRVESLDEAIDLANDSPYGLGGSVFTGDAGEAEEVAARLEVGMVGFNTIVKSAPDLPFGGVKSSGIGRELGRFGIEEFSNKKLVRVA
jgi:acyl-CoA reductase-like NAD-dependent aldehyde dehydrogenase